MNATKQLRQEKQQMKFRLSATFLERGSLQEYYLESDPLPNRTLLSSNFNWVNPNRTDLATMYDAENVVKWIKFLVLHVTRAKAINIQRVTEMGKI